ncbi:hypothetical protein EVAR_20167_1 [Eumeta japonica]|uniref:Uncharacterized protein n=1 Tax=Eumeta variegata TaxID=151549 RepID=A0A4C1UTS5_EUMVA|nr:hypothetical protein EVAR_20167_1 [Eumeta japonica]
MEDLCERAMVGCDVIGSCTQLGRDRTRDGGWCTDDLGSRRPPLVEGSPRSYVEKIWKGSQCLAVTVQLRK